MTVLKDLAVLVKGEGFGDTALDISGVSEIQNGKPGTITFLSNPKYKHFIENTNASAVVVNDRRLAPGKSGILVENPQLAFASILDHFSLKSKITPGIHEKALVHPKASIGSNVFIGPFAVIGEGAKIGDGVYVGSNVNIGNRTTIGSGTRIEAGVSIYQDCIIGGNTIIHSGTVIGCDGFGFVTEKGKHIKIPQVGKVTVEDNVEIGANCTIDRATIGETRIGNSTKLDNLVHIAHNVKIGKGCLLTAQVAIAGSVTIGDFCIFAGQSGVAPHLTIGDKAVFAAKSGVTKSLEGNKVYAGMPAREIRDQNLRDAALTRLEKLTNRVKAIEKTLSK